MIDLRVFERSWQVLGFERGAPYVAPWDAFDAYVERARGLSEALLCAEGDGLRAALAEHRRLDAALEVIGALLFKESYDRRPR
jgi:hypothetical protein